jgi:phosphoglycerate kinase
MFWWAHLRNGGGSTMNKSFLHKAFLYRQRVFVRADLNVPIAENGSIKNDKRLRTILPTIAHIQKHGGKVILASHIGRPSSNALDHHLSTRNLINWFEKQGLEIEFERDLLAAQTNSYHNPQSIMLLENLRFFVGEKNYSMPFAELLSNVADIYVNDAFGAMHRNDTSVSLLPQLFLPQNRGWGLLVDLELEALESLHDAPTQPFVLALGGAKIIDKIPLLNNFLAHHIPPAIIMLGGKIALPFLAADGANLGASCPTDEEIKAAQQVLAQFGQTKLLLPIDFVVTTDLTQANAAQTKSLTELTSKDIIIDIGPQTLELFVQNVAMAKTIFVNGTMGINQAPHDSAGTEGLLRAITAIDGLKVAGGGDAVAAIESLNLGSQMTFLSTGGGATLAYLGSENPWAILPGLKALGPAA